MDKPQSEVRIHPHQKSLLVAQDMTTKSVIYWCKIVNRLASNPVFKATVIQWTLGLLVPTDNKKPTACTWREAFALFSTSAFTFIVVEFDLFFQRYLTVHFWDLGEENLWRSCRPWWTCPSFGKSAQNDEIRYKWCLFGAPVFNVSKRIKTVETDGQHFAFKPIQEFSLQTLHALTSKMSASLLRAAAQVY